MNTSRCRHIPTHKRARKSLQLIRFLRSVRSRSASISFFFVCFLLHNILFFFRFNFFVICSVLHSFLFVDRLQFDLSAVLFSYMPAEIKRNEKKITKIKRSHTALIHRIRKQENNNTKEQKKKKERNVLSEQIKSNSN